MIFSTFIFSHSLRLTLSLVAGWLLLPFTMLTCSLRLSMLDARATTLTSYMVAPSAPATWYVIIDEVSNSTRIFLFATAVFNLENSEGRNSISFFDHFFSLHSAFVCSCAGWHKKLCYICTPFSLRFALSIMFTMFFDSERSRAGNEWALVGTSTMREMGEMSCIKAETYSSSVA